MYCTCSMCVVLLPSCDKYAFACYPCSLSSQEWQQGYTVTMTALLNSYSTCMSVKLQCTMYPACSIDSLLLECVEGTSTNESQDSSDEGAEVSAATLMPHYCKGRNEAKRRSTWSSRKVEPHTIGFSIWLCC